MADVWEQFFQIADADRDGKISGGEAVAFFQKSGLPQMTLAKVRKGRAMTCAQLRL